MTGLQLLRVAPLWIALTWVAVAQDSPPALTIASAACTSREKPVCEIPQTLRVVSKSLAAWTAAHPGKRPLILVVNGRAVAKEAGSEADAVLFDLKPSRGDKATKEAWSSVLGGLSGREADLDIAIAASDMGSVSPTVRLKLKLIPSYFAWVFAGLAMLLAFFIVLAIQSDIIRDSGPHPAAGYRKPYSLARAQMAWWLFIVAGCYLYILAMTGEWDTITEGVLVLLGISVATGGVAFAVDINQENDRRIGQLRGEAEGLKSRMAWLESQLAASPAPPNQPQLTQVLLDSRTRLAQVELDLSAIPPTKAEVSRGFLKDVLSENDVISFHRFQMLTWTFVLTLVFIKTVRQDLVMPEVSATLLGLMGISSGTYLGFKLPGK